MGGSASSKNIQDGETNSVHAEHSSEENVNTVEKFSEEDTSEVQSVDDKKKSTEQKPRDKQPESDTRPNENKVKEEQRPKIEDETDPQNDDVQIIGKVDDLGSDTTSNSGTSYGSSMFVKTGSNQTLRPALKKNGSQASEVENLDDGDNLTVMESTKQNDNAKADINILLIGLVGSGKSTMKKHVQLYLGKGFSIEDRKEYRRHIRRYVLQQSLELVLENWPYLNSLESEDRKPFTQFMQYCINKEIKIRPYIPLCNHTQAALKNLWSDKRFQDMFHSNPIWNSSSLDNFCGRCAEIGNDGYLPTDMDIIRIYGCLEKHKTTAIELKKPKNIYVELSEFRQPKSPQLKMCDVAMFFVDVSQIDTDHHQCSLKAALKMFNSVVNQQDLEDKQVVLFFTKYDLLLAKLKKVNILSIFPELGKRATPEEVCQHIISMFQDRYDQPLQHYFIEAFEFGKVQKTLDEVFQTVISSSGR